MRKHISVKGARANNLKNIDIEIPRDQLTVITGVSGSGKTSLAFDIIFGEGQRRFLESMSSFSKSRISQIEKADVDSILGLSPVVAIEQKQGVLNPRSTIGTMTDIATYLRLLFCIIGVAHCPYCHKEIPIHKASQIAERVLSLPQGTRIEIRSPVVKFYGEDFDYLFDDIREKGYRNVRIDGEVHSISDKIRLDEEKDYKIEVVIDRFIINKDIYKQLLTSIENANHIGDGLIQIEVLNPEILKEPLSEFFQEFTCPDHHVLMHELFPFYFSPNNPTSACRTCLGIGTNLKAEPFLLIKNKNKSLNQGALDWPSLLRPMYGLAEHYGFSLDTPFKDLPPKIVDIILYGTKGEKFKFILPDDYNKYKPRNVGKMITFEGYINYIDRLYRVYRKRGKIDASNYSWFKKHMVERTCPDCQGKKLKSQRFLVTVNGKNIYDLGKIPLSDLYEFLTTLPPSIDQQEVMNQIVDEITKRVSLLIEIGLDYLNLDRKAETISAGEGQRVRLSTQIGSELMGMLYVLDEPSIGLHPRDSQKVVSTLKRLRDIGNTVIVVEHDLDTIRAADHIVELGPGSGIHGGEIVAQGKLKDIINNQNFITGYYLNGKKEIPIPLHRREINGHALRIRGARENNLKNIDIEFPLGLFICITGVSGSGKSSLINEILYKGIYSKLRDARIIPGKHDAIEGLDLISDIRNIDQSPIGRSSRSNPATYVGFYDKIRSLYAARPEAVERGFNISYFSFNSKEGRCYECKGEGEIKTHLQFMPDVKTICPICKGARYNKEVLEINYKGKSIAEVLDLTIEEGLIFFKDIRLIKYKLKVMHELGLGYLKLGQSSTTLSGGEAQRIKLAKELSKLKRNTNNLYILDEPTTGLHMEDIQRLLDCLNRLVDAGNTVLVIEHHLDIIKTADYIIDLGPDGGAEGGYVVAKGRIEDILQTPSSYTGQYLKKLLPE
ncbi:MAG: excinuclease ABC subunit UvrA, partial [Promethearchaeota archaeon]